jgi:predicted ABC-type ATPase
MITEKPNLLIIAGPNGSGKTSVTSKILQHHWIKDCLYINPDNIARDDFGDWNSPEAIIKAANKASELREESLLNMKSILFETVLSAPDKIDYIRRAKESGYFIRLFFVGTDHPSINASRVTQRVIKGGHDVPIPKIISRFSKSIANCSILAPFVDRFYAYDNSEEYADPKLLFRAKDGILVKKYSKVNIWAQSILIALKSND